MTQFLRTPWHLVSTVAAIGVLLAACGKGQPAAAPAATDTAAAPSVAVVNGVAIPRADYDAFLKNLLQGKPVPPDLTAEQKKSWQVAMQPTWQWAEGRVGKEVLAVMQKSMGS